MQVLSPLSMPLPPPYPYGAYGGMAPVGPLADAVAGRPRAAAPAPVRRRVAGGAGAGVAVPAAGVAGVPRRHAGADRQPRPAQSGDQSLAVSDEPGAAHRVLPGRGRDHPLARDRRRRPLRKRAPISTSRSTTVCRCSATGTRAPSAAATHVARCRRRWICRSSRPSPGAASRCASRNGWCRACSSASRCGSRPPATAGSCSTRTMRSWPRAASARRCHSRSTAAPARCRWPPSSRARAHASRWSPATPARCTRTCCAT